MPGFNDGFLDVPPRPGKPRQSGLTHVMDKGLNLRDIEGMFDSGGEYVDIAPYQWVQWIKEEKEAGAWKVITEAREGGSSGIFRKDGDMRTGLIDEIAHEVSIDDLIFEAPTKSSQAWFVKQFGPNVNLGNIPPEEVIPLETLRRRLRGDTMLEVLLGSEPAPAL